MAKFQSNHKKVVKLKPAGKWFFWEVLSEETRQNIVGVIFLILTVLLTLSYFDLAGIVGNVTFKIFNFLLGFGYNVKCQRGFSA